MLHWMSSPMLMGARYIPYAAAPPPVWETAPVWDGDGTAPESGPNMGHSDFDQLPNWYEDYLGTDKYNPDTDGDGIIDSDELLTTNTNPLDADSDDNGWSDYEDFSGQSLITADPDNDGVTNADEINAGTNPRNADSDGDGLGDGLEISLGAAYSPVLSDTDGDGISDYSQYYNIPNPDPPPPAPVDSDGDGLSDEQEGSLGTLPHDSDTDDDGLSDGVEVSWGSSPTDMDSDDDGADDATEHALSLNPQNPDTDGDGLMDGYELAATPAGSLNPALVDTDGDGESDYIEVYGQPPPPPPADTDGDTLTDDQEAALGTNPNASDTDGDGLDDALELSWGSNPLVPDTDGDNLQDGTEYLLETSPVNADTDGDLLQDDYEVTVAHTNPKEIDTDGDGLGDYYEIVVANPQTNPLSADTDGDMLTDAEEVNAAIAFPGFSEPLSPVAADSDGDEVPDYLEVRQFLGDSDGGGIPDRIEALYGLNPHNMEDDTGDLDADGWTNLQEFEAGNSLNGGYSGEYDWDRDGMTNVWEMAHGLDPHNRADAAEDPDGDWLLNKEEFQDSKNPAVPDSGLSGNDNHGQPLVRGAEFQSNADWDQDGVPNLSELLDYHTNPRDGVAPANNNEGGGGGGENGGQGGDPDPYSCGCGGNNCTTCTEEANCGGTQCNTPPYSCGCGGSNCTTCTEEFNCGGIQCNTPPYSCGCGGNNCTTCTEESNCGGSQCNSIPPCECGMAFTSNCNCPDANSGCMGMGDCYTPPPCECANTTNGNGCSCSTVGQCEQNGCLICPCGCDSPGTCPISCTAYSHDCMDNSCQCPVKQNNAEDCDCGNADDCDDDCDNDQFTVSISGPNEVFVSATAIAYACSQSQDGERYTYSWTISTHGTADDTTKDAANVTWATSGEATIDLSVTDTQTNKTASANRTVKVYRAVAEAWWTPQGARLTFGVGEKASLKVYLGSQAIDGFTWDVITGNEYGVIENGETLKFKALPGGVHIHATNTTATGCLDLTSIEPDGLSFKRWKPDQTAINPPANNSPGLCEAHMWIEITVKPQTVNWGALLVTESHPPIPELNVPEATRGVPSAQVSHFGNNLAGPDHVSQVIPSPDPTDVDKTIDCTWEWRVKDTNSDWKQFQGSPFPARYLVTPVDNGQATWIRLSKFGLTVDNGGSPIVYPPNQD